MGNRATITPADYNPDNLAVYVHWNGGRESVEAFCAVARELNFRPISDCYGMARLVYAIGVYFGGELSLGVDRLRDLRSAGGDNGTWLVDDEWQVVGHRDCGGREMPLRAYTPDMRYHDIVKRTLRQIRAAEAAGKEGEA